ncbi:hypothetical protein ACFX19_019110 [Malus domestica]
MSKKEHDYRFDVFKTDIVEHPLYKQLVSAHMSCLRIATSIDQLPRIDEQLVQSQSMVDKYSGVDEDVGVMDEKYLDLLHSIKEQLHQHVRVQCNGCAVAVQLLCLGGKDLVELVDVGHEVGAGETLVKDCRDVGGADDVAATAGDPFLHDGRLADFGSMLRTDQNECENEPYMLGKLRMSIFWRNLQIVNIIFLEEVMRIVALKGSEKG